MADHREHNFLAALWRLQEEAGLSDSELARTLSVHYSLISHTKAGRRRLGRKLILAAVEQFPSLGSLLSLNVPVVTNELPTGTEAGAAA